MKLHWHNSIFRHNEERTQTIVDHLFSSPSFGSKQKLHLFVKGTNFQVKVWEALLRIPMGEVTTYQQVANSIANPGALQAVGSAVGSNHVAYLIPCHRVIRKDGVLGEYRWSSARKKTIIGWEMAKAG